MKREHKLTSKLGELHIAPHKETHFDKIKRGLELLKVGGTHEQISDVCGLRPDQVWKRLSEMKRAGTVYETGLFRQLKSSVLGTVWQLTEAPSTQPEMEVVFTLPPDPPILQQGNLF